MAKPSGIKIAVLSVIVAVTAWAALRTNAAIDFRSEYIEVPGADEMQKCDGVLMSKADCFLHTFVKPKVGPVSMMLLARKSSYLWGLLYTLYGIIGCYIYYLFVVVQPSQARGEPKPFLTKTIFARLVLSGCFGFVSFLIVKLLQSPLAGALGFEIPGLPPEDASGRQHALSESLVLVPVLAGLFIGIFYQHLESLFQALMGRLTHLKDAPARGK